MSAPSSPPILEDAWKLAVGTLITIYVSMFIVTYGWKKLWQITKDFESPTCGFANISGMYILFFCGNAFKRLKQKMSRWKRRGFGMTWYRVRVEKKFIWKEMEEKQQQIEDLHFSQVTGAGLGPPCHASLGNDADVNGTTSSHRSGVKRWSAKMLPGGLEKKNWKYGNCGRGVGDLEKQDGLGREREIHYTKRGVYS